jgi:hypothetical protein
MVETVAFQATYHGSIPSGARVDAANHRGGEGKEASGGEGLIATCAPN